VGVYIAGLRVGGLRLDVEGPGRRVEDKAYRVEG
jgi:hypothetical protein